MKKILLITSSILTISFLAGCSEYGYKITWINNDGIKISESTAQIGEHPIHEDPTSAITNPKGFHYVFTNWKDQNGTEYSNDYVVSNFDIIFSAQYELVPYTCKVTWLNDDDSILYAENVGYYAHPTYNLEEPVSALTPSEGHSLNFIGWTDTNGNKYDENYFLEESDVTFKATYSHSVNSHTVSWFNDDNSLISESTHTFGSHPTHDEPSSSLTPRTGYHYEFDNWVNSDGNNYSSDFTMPDHDVIFTARFKEKINSYKITWEDEYEGFVDNTYVDYNCSPTHENLRKDKDLENQLEYVFEGWYVNGKKVNLSEYKVTGDVTIVGKYNVFNLGGCNYSLNEDGESYSATGMAKNYPSNNYTILDTYRGKPVTVIGEDAFFRTEKTNLSFTIGKNVEIISAYSFFDNDISSIIFVEGSKLKSIGESAFGQCVNLKTFKAPSTLEYIGQYAFLGLHDLEVFDLSELDHVVELEGDPFHFIYPNFWVKNEQMLDAYKTAWPNHADRISIKS